jgi:hypothetical protein
MATNRPTLEKLERLDALAKLSPDAVLCSADAALYCGVSPPSWERMRAQGRTPPAIRLTRRTLGYRKHQLDLALDARTEAAG